VPKFDRSVVFVANEPFGVRDDSRNEERFE
jgi:hypothetical protein